MPQTAFHLFYNMVVSDKIRCKLCNMFAFDSA